MAYCTNCGSFVKDGAKFCGVCGSKVEPATQADVKTEGTEAKRKMKYDGEVHKCPHCGATLSSFTRTCPECGKELRGTESAESVSDFSRRYAAATSNGKKVDLIRTFVIPNTKEDILEFAILASSNIDEGSFSRDNVVVSGGVSQTEVSEAWMAKFEQAYQKATILLQGDPTLDRITKLYEEKKKSLSSAKVKSVGGKVVKGIFGNDFVKIMLPFVVLMLIIPLVFSFTGTSEKKLEKQVKQVEAYIAEENYDSALTTAYAMSDNYSSSWSETRANLISRIKELQGESEHKDGEIRIPTKDYSGEQYSDAVAAFETAGFTNVKAEPVEYDLLTGWADKLTETKGSVEEISINGNTSYDKGGWASPDAAIIIRYHH